DGVLLVGDAAGLAYPASGEGIRPAVESGLMAADVVLAARGRYRREDLAPYRTELSARFGRGRVSPALPGPAGLMAAAGRQLFRSRAFTRRVVLDRWFLREDVPALRRRDAPEPSPAAPR